MRERRSPRASGWIFVALLAARLAAQDPLDLTPREKSELFLEHLLRFAGTPREKVMELALRYELAAALSSDEESGVDLVGDFIREAILETQERFRDALRAIESGDDAAAEGILRELASGRDPYLKAYARFEAAKIHVRAGRHAEAVEILDRLLRENRMQLIPDTEARLLSARSLEGLERDLVAYLEYLLFLVQFPEAPKEMRQEAMAKAQALEGKIGRPLTHIASRMDRIGTWLGEEKTAEDPTQKEERELVSALDKFIELAEERERRTCPQCGSCSCSGHGQGSNAAARSRNPATLSRLRESGGETILGRSREGVGRVWGELRDREEEEILQGYRERLPERYRKLLERYYEGLSKRRPATDERDR